MLASADHGTGRLAVVSPHRVYSKTGTTISDLVPTKAEAQPSHPTEGWCISVVTDLEPALLIMTRINPGKGAAAAPLAGTALRAYLELSGHSAHPAINTGNRKSRRSS